MTSWEREAVEACRAEVARAEQDRQLSERRLEQAKREAARVVGEADRIDAEERMHRLGEELATGRPPLLPRLLADDATPEALVSLLADHGRIAVVSAEGGIFDLLAGRYSDRVPNLDAVLKAHNGEPIRVDRKGRAAEYVERPSLVLALAVQPDVLETIRENRAFRGRGLLARFLYLQPTIALGRRSVDAVPVPEEVRQAYGGRLRELLPSPQNPHNPQNPPAELTLDGEAAAAHREFRAAVEVRLDPGSGDLAAISGWAGKLPGAVARIAGLPISPATAARGWSGRSTGPRWRRPPALGLRRICETAEIAHGYRLLDGGTTDRWRPDPHSGYCYSARE